MTYLRTFSPPVASPVTLDCELIAHRRPRYPNDPGAYTGEPDPQDIRGWLDAQTDEYRAEVYGSDAWKGLREGYERDFDSLKSQLSAAIAERNEALKLPHRGTIAELRNRVKDFEIDLTSARETIRKLELKASGGIAAIDVLKQSTEAYAEDLAKAEETIRALTEERDSLRGELGTERTKRADAERSLASAHREAPGDLWRRAQESMEFQWASVPGEGGPEFTPYEPPRSDDVKPAHDPGHPHLINGEFQSDKYPTCPRGKVPLSVKDVTAQDLLWAYAQRRRSVDAEFATDLERTLRTAGYEPPRSEEVRPNPHADSALRCKAKHGGIGFMTDCVECRGEVPAAEAAVAPRSDDVTPVCEECGGTKEVRTGLFVGGGAEPRYQMKPCPGCTPKTPAATTDSRVAPGHVKVSAEAAGDLAERLRITRDKLHNLHAALGAESTTEALEKIARLAPLTDRERRIVAAAEAERATRFRDLDEYDLAHNIAFYPETLALWRAVDLPKTPGMRMGDGPRCPHGYPLCDFCDDPTNPSREQLREKLRLATEQAEALTRVATATKADRDVRHTDLSQYTTWADGKSLQHHGLAVHAKPQSLAAWQASDEYEAKRKERGWT